MAAKKTTPEKILFTRYQNGGGKMYRGEFLQSDQNKFLIRISEQQTDEKTVIDTKNQSRIREIDMLKPGKNIKGSEARAEAQKNIDEHLKKNDLSVLDATKKVIPTKGKFKGVEVYQIESDLDMEVEYYLKEERYTEKIEIERLSTELTWKPVKELDWYCRLQAFQFRKALTTIVNEL
jgi:hypothetical protein